MKESKIISEIDERRDVPQKKKKDTDQHIPEKDTMHTKLQKRVAVALEKGLNQQKRSRLLNQRRLL